MTKNKNDDFNKCMNELFVKESRALTEKYNESLIYQIVTNYVAENFIKLRSDFANLKNLAEAASNPLISDQERADGVKDNFQTLQQLLSQHKEQLFSNHLSKIYNEIAKHASEFKMLDPQEAQDLTVQSLIAKYSIKITNQSISYQLEDQDPVTLYFNGWSSLNVKDLDIKDFSSATDASNTLTFLDKIYTQEGQFVDTLVSSTTEYHSNVSNQLSMYEAMLTGDTEQVKQSPAYLELVAKCTSYIESNFAGAISELQQPCDA